ncbi:MAG: MBL fold metallo-hydrolase [Patescibacteria group bacterium]
MHISWLGMSCFKIQNKDTIIVINPYQDSNGLKMPKMKANIVISSNPDNDVCNNFSRMMGDYFQIDHPGEYEIQDNFIYGLQAGEVDQQQSSIYLIELEKIRVAHLGILNHSLTDKQLEIMEGADILLLPISSLTPERRTKVISQIEPRIVIPMYYQIPKCKLKLESLDKFSREMGGTKTETQDKIILKRKDLPQDETKLMLLKPQI